MSYAEEFKQFEEFLMSDPEYARIQSEINRLQELCKDSRDAAETATRSYHKWMCCEGALEWFSDDCDDSGDLAFTGLNHELVREYLADGQELFEQMKRAELVKAGEASSIWLKASADLKLVKESYSKVRMALVEVWDAKRENK
tara:strand:+ start:143 stop:571 length:429 start_codon:yes stop_codon:yes gene_type:complete